MEYDPIYGSIIVTDYIASVVSLVSADGLYVVVGCEAWINIDIGIVSPVGGSNGIINTFTPGVGLESRFERCVEPYIHPNASKFFYITDDCGVRILCMYWNGVFVMKKKFTKIRWICSATTHSEHQHPTRYLRLCSMVPNSAHHGHNQLHPQHSGNELHGCDNCRSEHALELFVRFSSQHVH